MTLTFNNIKYIKISLASPQRIRELSYGEVKKPETKNYKTFKPERDGLFCERIFGPERDYECSCGKYKRKKIKTKGIICDKCGVEVTKSDVRRERMGHIELAAPVVHFWFLQGNPGIISILLDLEDKQIKEVVYFESFVCTDLQKENINKLMFLIKLDYIRTRNKLLKELENEYQSLFGDYEKIREDYQKVREEYEKIKQEYEKETSESQKNEIAKKYKELEKRYNELKEKYEIAKQELPEEHEKLKKALEFATKVGNLLIENSPLFQMDSKKIEKLERKLDEDYAFIVKKLYTEAKKIKGDNKAHINNFIKIFENIENIDKGRSDKGYKGYLEIQRLLHKISFKEIFKNEEKELLYETEKYEKEKVVFLNMVINLKEELERIIKISIDKLSELSIKYKDKSEFIERKINLDVGAKLSTIRDKNIYKKIKKDLDTVLKSVIYQFISYLDSLIENSKNYPDYISFIDSYKFSIKDLRKILNDCNQVVENLYYIDENQELAQENPHLIREIKNLNTELHEYKQAISEVINIVDIMDNLRKIYNDFDQKVSEEVKVWRENYLSKIYQYQKLKQEYFNNKAKLLEKSKDSIADLIKKLKELENELLDLYEDFINNIFSSIDSKFIQKVVRMLSENFTVFFRLETGAKPIRELLSRIDLEQEKNEIKKILAMKKGDKKLLRRLGIINSFIKGNIRPEWMVLEVLPVLPPELRPIVQLEGGKFASSDLNDLYRRIINRNNRLKRLIEIQAPEIIINNEKRMLQKAVDALIDNAKTKRPIVVSNRRVLKSLSDNIQGKHGRFRYNLLGKRVDYSGRSVIVVNPKLKFYECGLPEEMVLELFKPFIINKLIEEGKADNIKKAKRMLELRKPEIWPTVQRVVENFPVILNRAPTLHRLSIQAFYPKIVKTKAIQIHPLVCAPYNADFDGDQMAVHVPLSVEAMLEYRNLLLSINNMLIPANGEPANVPSQDMVLGAFWLTFGYQKPDSTNIYISSYEEAEKRYFELKEPLYTWVYYKVDFDKVAFSIGNIQDYKESKILTTIGRIIFNNAIRKYIPDFPFINFVVGKKELKWIVEECIYNYGMSETQPVLDELKEIGFLFATRSGTTISIDELVIPPKKFEIIGSAEKEQSRWEEMYELGLLNDEEYKKKIIDTWYEATDKITQEFKSYMSNYQPLNSIWILANSGARGNVDQAKQLVAIRGLMVNPKGEIIPLPIKNSFTEGLGIFDYFIASHGGRKGLVDTALRTADAGYLTRRLVDVAQDVVVREEDCKTDEYITIKPIKIINYNYDPEEISVENCFGRVLAEDVNGIAKKFDVINWQIYKDLIKSEKNYVKVFIEEELLPLANRVRGRVAAQDFVNPETGQLIVEKGQLIDRKKAKEISKYYLEAKVRSVLKCKVFKGVCRKCYGEDLGLGNVLVDLGEAVGIISAQSIGEPGTQLTLRTFHTGGVALESDIIQGIPRVQELLEVRKKTRFHSNLFALEDSVVERIYSRTASKVVVLRGLDSGREYSLEVPLNKKIIVTEGQKVNAGNLIVMGTLSPKEFVDKVIEDVLSNDREADLIHHPNIRKAIEIAQMYVLDEMQKVYLNQGVSIHDKHMEIIIRQMFRFVRVDDPGDSTLMYGELVDKNIVAYINEIIAKRGGKLVKAVPEVLPISKAALESESWLSAASFQETTKVISYSAISGKKDYLVGLKENIIIGKPIPVGTNYPLYKNVTIEEMIEEKV